MVEESFERFKQALSDRYRLDRQTLGNTDGAAYPAEDLRHHRRVLIKVLPTNLAESVGAEHFLQEIGLAGRLQHPHILPVYDSGVADGIFYFVMPSVSGESLRSLLNRKGSLPIEQASRILSELAGALSYAYAKGVVHRTVNPDNIIISAGTVLLTGFGLVQPGRRPVPVQRNSPLKELAYLSPEQLLGNTVDNQTDQYSLAAVFYEMVTGHPPFEAADPATLLQAITTAPRPLLKVPGMTSRAAETVQLAMAISPDERFPDVKQFAKVIESEAGGVAIAVRESRRWRRLAIALPLLVLALVGGYLLFGRERGSIIPGAEAIAVLPFTAMGPGLEGLGDGIADLLPANINGVGDVRTIEPRAVLREWNRTRPDPGNLTALLEIGRKVKAASVLTGSIVTTGERTRITADLYDLTGRRLAQVQANGSSESVLALIDSLSVQILREVWRSVAPLPLNNGVNITSSSLVAIRSYLRGESYHRREIWDSAAVAFENAIAEDSTFALAWYRLANTLGWATSRRNHDAINAANYAERYSTGLTPRLRSLMVLNKLFYQDDPAAIDSALAFTRKFPNDLDGWYLLGESRYHFSSYRPASPLELREPFDRVLALDSSLAPAAIHPADLALLAGDTLGLRGYERVFRMNGDSLGAQRLEAARLLLANPADSAALARLIADGSLGITASQNARMSRLRRTDSDSSEFRRIATIIGNLPVNPDYQSGLRYNAALVLAGIGDTLASRGAVSGLPEEAVYRTILELFDAMVGMVDETELSRLDHWLVQRRDSVLKAGGRPSHASPLYQGIIALDRGNAVKAKAQARQVLENRNLAAGEGWMRDAATVLHGLAVVVGGDTLKGLAQADSGLRQLGEIWITPISPALQLRYAQVQVARQQTRAEGIKRLKHAFDRSPETIPLNQLRLGRAYELAGTTDSAVAYYRAFLQRYAGPDNSPLIRQARSDLNRLTGERPETRPVGRAGGTSDP